MLPKSYILTRSGLFQDFGAVSRTNVLSKPLYCAAGSLLGSDDRSLVLNLTTEKETSCVERDLGECRVQKAAGKVLLRLLPGCVYKVAAELCLQPCRKEPLLKTNGITFQWSQCQVLESRATFDNFTQFSPADSSTGQGRVWNESPHHQVSSPSLSTAPG